MGDVVGDAVGGGVVGDGVGANVGSHHINTTTAIECISPQLSERVLQNAWDSIFLLVVFRQASDSFWVWVLNHKTGWQREYVARRLRVERLCSPFISLT